MEAARALAPDSSFCVCGGDARVWQRRMAEYGKRGVTGEWWMLRRVREGMEERIRSVMVKWERRYVCECLRRASSWYGERGGGEECSVV